MNKRWFRAYLWLPFRGALLLLIVAAINVAPSLSLLWTSSGTVKYARTAPNNLQFVVALSDVEKSFDSIEVFRDATLESSDVVYDGVINDRRAHHVFVDLCAEARKKGFLQVADHRWDASATVRENVALTWDWLTMPESSPFGDMVSSKGAGEWAIFENRKDSGYDGYVIVAYDRVHVLTYAWHRQRWGKKQKAIQFQTPSVKYAFDKSLLDRFRIRFCCLDNGFRWIGDSFGELLKRDQGLARIGHQRLV